jgi:hypothetical protein
MTVQNNQAPILGSRAGALPYPRAVRLRAQVDREALLSGNLVLLFDPAGGMVDSSAQPPRISFRGIRQPVWTTVVLYGATVDDLDVRFLPDPYQAASFGAGSGMPPAFGTASGMFKPQTVSADGRELSFVDANIGDGAEYRAVFNTTFQDPPGGQTLRAAKGDPIIIND